MINLGLTTTFNSSTVNDIRLAYLRDVNQTGQPTTGQGLGVTLASQGYVTPWGPEGGISPTNASYEGVANLMFNNFSLGVPPDALRQYNNTFQIIDNVTKILGTHTLQFGANLHYNQINERNYDCYNGCFGFNGSETGVDFADFLIGAPNSFVQASQQLLDSRSKYYGFYAQDSWRATRNLTLNYGLRWEVASPWYDTQNKLETVVAGEQSLSFPTAPVGQWSRRSRHSPYPGAYQVHQLRSENWLCLCAGSERRFSWQSTGWCWKNQHTCRLRYLL